MSENEWIDENLKRIISSDKVEYVNRKGKFANYEDERDDVIETIERLGLAKCDNFGGVLMSLGEVIRDEYDGSYLNYLESLDEKPKKWWNRIRKWHKVLIWTLGGIIMFLSIIALLFQNFEYLQKYRTKIFPSSRTEQIDTNENITSETDSLTY